MLFDEAVAKTQWPKFDPPDKAHPAGSLLMWLPVAKGLHGACFWRKHCDTAWYVLGGSRRQD